MGGITLQPLVLTQKSLLFVSDGTELATNDGEICTLTAGECVTAAGVKYVVDEGKLVVAVNDKPVATALNDTPVAVNEGEAGRLDPVSVFVLIMLLISFRYLAVSCRKKQL